jgi:hypothetical protein
MPALTVMLLARADTLKPLLPAICCLPTNLIGRYISDGRTLADLNPMPLSSTKVRANIETLLPALMLQKVFMQWMTIPW